MPRIVFTTGDQVERHLQRSLQRILVRTLARSQRDLARLYKRHLQAEIDRATVRRTGALRAVRIKTFKTPGVQRSRTLAPTFPRTAYRTPAGRGRPGASKSGQYAFVLNHRRAFIQAAIARFQRDPAVSQVLTKHFNFIANQVLRGGQ